MYTVKELIEALEQCPEDYVVRIDNYDIQSVGIYHLDKIVDLFS